MTESSKMVSMTIVHIQHVYVDVDIYPLTDSCINGWHFCNSRRVFFPSSHTIRAVNNWAVTHFNLWELDIMISVSRKGLRNEKSCTKQQLYWAKWRSNEALLTQWNMRNMTWEADLWKTRDGRNLEAGWGEQSCEARGLSHLSY